MGILSARGAGKRETGLSGLAYDLEATYIAPSNKSRAVNEEEVGTRLWMDN